MSFVLLGILNSQASEGGLNYFLANLDSVNSDAADAIEVDASGNIILSGNSTTNFATQLSPELNINWQIGLDTGFASTRQAVDSSGNLYMVYFSDQTGTREPGIAKFNSNGTLQWQRVIDGGSNAGFPYICLDNNELPVIAFRDFDSGYKLVLIRYDASGNVDDFKTTDYFDDIFVRGIGVLSNDEFNVSITPNPDRFQTLHHTDTTLGFSRAEELNNSNQISNNLLVAQLPSGNFSYVVDNDLLQAFTFSFSILWQKQLTYTGIVMRAAAHDSQGFLYFAGFGDKTAGSGDDGIIIKTDNNGTPQWARKLGFTSHSTRLEDIFIDSNDDIFVSGFSDLNQSAFIAKLPNDGSLTGTYTLDDQEIIYDTAGVSFSNTSFSISGRSASEIQNFNSSITGTSSTTTPSFTIETTGIG